MEKAIYIGNDTAGFYLKSKCIEYLEGKGIPYVDCGSADDPDIEATRYPFFAAKVAKAVASGEARCGLLICGTGIGISMAANKFKGIRAALVNSTYLARMTRRHNDANILCLGGRGNSHSSLPSSITSIPSSSHRLYTMGACGL